MLNDLFHPFASMPATIHYDPKTPSVIEGFTLHYDKKRLNVTVERIKGGAIEIDIESFDNFFGPHLVGVASEKWAIEFGEQRSVLLAVITKDRHLLFADIQTNDEAKQLLDLIDLIIKTNQHHRRMIEGFCEKYNSTLKCEWQEDSSSLHIYGCRGNVSVYNINNLVMVYIQSDSEPYVFEQYLSRPPPPPEMPFEATAYVLSYNKMHFGDAQCVEDEIYMFCFRFPQDEERICMLVDVAVEILKAHV